ncbi:MAG: hypothetical protein DDT18_01852 [Actinobacteria bacterium]|nr:hypothetical protein [Actinomycetota bacterium]
MFNKWFCVKNWCNNTYFRPVISHITVSPLLRSGRPFILRLKSLWVFLADFYKMRLPITEKDIVTIGKIIYVKCHKLSVSKYFGIIAIIS